MTEAEPLAELTITQNGSSKRKKKSVLTDEEKAEKIEREREALLLAAESGDLDTMHKRVARVLNHYPATRNSDIALQLAYWEMFELEFDGYSITPADMYKFTRLTSLARARATIQNKYQLFVASPEIRKHRGMLSDEEKQKILEQEPAFPSWIVYADESGKQSARLVVGSIWILHPPAVITVDNAIRGFRQRAKYDAEFKFTAITPNNASTYHQLLDVVTQHSDALSFKAVSMDSAGIRVDTGIEGLYYHLLVRGIAHENATGRAPLPRGLNFTKDAEEKGRDELLLADLKERLKVAAAVQFDNNFSVDRLTTGISEHQSLLQIADLFAGSLNRLLERGNAGVAPKDVFAQAFFQKLGISTDTSETATESDRAVHMFLGQ